MTFCKGALVRVEGSWTDVATNTAVDPATITLRVKAPSGTETTYTLAGEDVVQDSSGHYHCDVDADESGPWSYRWETTSPQSAVEGGFSVDGSRFA